LRLEVLEDRLAPAVFMVNTLADILNPPSGIVTLRSAIEAANNTPGGNMIELTVPGRYKITIPGSAQDNTQGEFSIGANGGNLTIENGTLSSTGTVVIDSGGLNRVFDINNADSTTPFTVAFTGVTITDGYASPGDADQGSGGGIRAQGGASVALTNVILTNNNATADGGGISMESPSNNSTGTLTIMDSTISYNHASDSGGGIETDGTGQVSIRPGTIIDFNTAVNNGGGIWLDTGAAALNVASCVISNNAAVSVGGGIGNGGPGNVTISNSLVQNNIAGDFGGGFGDSMNKGNLTVSNSLFFNNAAVASGGGIEEGGPNTTITGSVFQGNTSLSVGGGLAVSSTSTSVTDTVFRGNVAGEGGGLNDAAGTLTVTGSTFDANHTLAQNGGNGNTPGSGGSGGGIDVQIDAGPATVTSSLFIDNVSGGGSVNFGGGIYDQNSTLSLSDSQFTGNVAGGGGGGLYAGGSLDVTNTTFANNRTNGAGGALEAGSVLANLTNDTFFGNVSAGSGGAIENNGSGGIAFLSDTITGNTAGNNGGGVDVASAPSLLRFTNAIVFGNSAAATGPDLFTNGVAVTDQGGNLIGNTSGSTGFGSGTLVGVNPDLGPVEDNGGQAAGAPSDREIVQTEALLPASPALGHGSNASSNLTTDERGFPRPAAPANPSIGAYEPQYAAGSSANQVFVENVYEVLLNRTADPGGLAAWTARLNGGASPSSIVLAIENSTEYETDVVEQLYQHYLHRQADSGGLQFFVAALATGSTSESIATTMIGSNEYFVLHGVNNFILMDALYEDTLNRPPDPFGMDAFSQLLVLGQSPGTIADLVFGSAEYQTDLVESYYQTLLGRQADPGGLAFFLQKLGSGTTSEQALAMLLGSQEAFDNRS